MMKKLYHYYMDYCRNKLAHFKYRFLWVSEWVAIFRKRKLYKGVKWTPERQKEFDEYWTKHFGRRISNRWHRLYESINGVYCVDYVPDVIYATKYEPAVSTYNYCEIFSDKYLTEIMYSNVIPGVRAPRTLLCADSFSYYDGSHCPVSYSKAVELFSDIGKAVIKPSTGTCSGKMVKIVCMGGGIDKKSGDSAQEILKQYGMNFIVQELICQHPDLEALYPGSVNTLRYITYRTKNGFVSAPALLRIGSGGGELDNIHAGGMGIGMDNDGILMEKAYRLGYGDSNETFTRHPDTHIVFKGYKIPMMKQIHDAACTLHSRTPNIGVIAWDITVNDQNEIIIIEANCAGQGIWLPQIVSEKSVFEENTPWILEMLGKHKNGDK